MVVQSKLIETEDRPSLLCPRDFDHASEPLAVSVFDDPAALMEQLRFEDGKVFLGADEVGNLYGHSDDCMSIIVGSTRSGKGLLGIATLTTTPSSIFASTCKADLMAVIGPRRGKGHPDQCDGLGQPVWLFDGHHVVVRFDEYRQQFNPIESMLDPDDPNCQAIADMLTCCFQPHAIGHEDYFKKDSRSLISSFKLHVRTYSAFENRRHYGTVHDLITEGDVAAFDALAKRNLIKEGDTPHSVLFEAMIDNPACGGAIARQGRYLLSMHLTAPKQLQGVLSEAAAALSCISHPGIREMLSRTTIELSDLKFKPGGVSAFVVVDEFLAPSAAGITQMLFSCAFVMMKRPGRPATGQSVRFWLDEVGSMGRVEVLEQAMATAAGYGASVTLCVQSLSQLKRNYGEDGMHALLSGCSLRVLLDCRDEFTATHFEKICGDKEVVVQNNSLGASEGENSSVAVGENVQSNLNWQESEGEQSGTSHAQGASEGGSSGTGGQESVGHNFKGGLLWRIIPKFLKPWWSVSKSRGANWNDGRNWNTNVSDTVTQSKSRNSAFGGGVAVGSNKSRTEGTQRTESVNRAEARQVRPLLPVSEVIRRYAKFRTDGTPARCLVHICGMHPFELIRVRPWEHSYFFRKFAKDPEYEFVQAPRPDESVTNLASPVLAKPVVTMDDAELLEERVRSGEELYFLRIPGYLFSAAAVAAGVVLFAPDVLAVGLLSALAIKRRAEAFVNLKRRALMVRNEVIAVARET